MNLCHAELTPFSPQNVEKIPETVLIMGLEILSLIIADFNYKSFQKKLY